MNKIFRIVWSQATQSWVVVSELTKAHKKQSASNAQKSAVKFSGNFLKSSAIALTLLSGHSAYAALNQAGTGSDNNVAVGQESKATQNNAVAVGKKAQATGDSAIALGFDSESSGNWSVAIGLQTNASNKQAVAVGSKSQATGENSIAIGNAAKASNESSVALGSSAESTNKYTTAVGGKAFATQEGATALGYGARATATNTIAIGNLAKAEQEGVLALGSASVARGKDTIAIGNSADAKKEGDIIIGKDAKSRNESGGRSVAIGYDSTAGSTQAKAATDITSIGKNDASGSVAIGVSSYTGVNKNNAAINSSVAIGAGAGAGFRAINAEGLPTGNGTDPDDNATVLVKAFGGTTSKLDYFKKTGDASKDGFFSFQGVDINEGTALGRNTRAIGDQSVAIGAQSIAGMGSIVIGGNDIQAYDGKKYFKAADPNSADARSVNDFNAAVTPGTGKRNPTDKTESELTISEKYKELVGAGLDRSYRASYGQDGSTVIGMQAHSTTPLGVAIGTNSIVRKGAFGSTAIGSGASIVANAEAAVAIGMGAEAQGNYAVAAGTAARAKESAVAAGYQANADKSAVAVGDSSKATTSSVAVGRLAQATKEADIAVGQGAVASGEQGAIAMGLGTQAQGDSSIMIGGSEITKVANQRVSYQKEKIGADGKAVIKTEKKTEMIGGVPTDRTVRSVTMENTSGTIQQAYGELTNGGSLNIATLDYSLVANRNGHGSISMGIHSLSTGDLGTAIGTGARVTKLGGVALGTGAISELQNGVAIGTGSRADSRSIGTRQTDISYDENGKIVPFDSKAVAYTFYWAGGTNTSEGDIVSFGTPGAERQLKNVAAGRIADDSTDAINGSQLNSVTKRMSSGWTVEAEKDHDSSGVLKLKGTEATGQSVNYATDGKSSTKGEIGTATGHVDKVRLNDEVKIRVGDNLVLNQENATRDAYEDPDNPNRKTGTHVTSKFTYSLNPVLKKLKSAEFKNDAGDTTVIDGNSVTVTPVGPNKQSVALTTTGLNNGGNAISNVAGNLPSTKNNDAAATDPSNATKSQDAPTLGNTANQVNPTNAATVSDVLNAGWNIQGDGKAVDFVKPYDTVNFAKGDGTSVSVESKDGKTSTVKYSVNLGNGLEKDANNNITVKAADKSLTVDTNGVKVNPADKSLEVTDAGLKVKAGDKTLTTDEKGLKVNTGDIESVTTGANPGTVKVKDADAGKIATVDSVVSAVNSAAFTLKASANGGTRNTGSSVTETGESIKAGSTVEMIAGKNLDVKHDTSGKITFATVDNPSFSTVQVGGDQGPKLNKSDAGDLKVSGSNGTDPVKITNVEAGDVSATSTDAINGSQFHGLAKNKIKLAGKNGDAAATETTDQTLDQKDGIKFTIKSSDGTLLDVAAAGDTITLTPKTATLTTGTDGVPTANTDGGKLVTADQLVTALKEMGWKATAGNEGTGTVTGNAEELIKAGNTVTFKAGDNLAIKQEGKNFIYSLKPALSGLTSAEFKDANNNNKVNITPEGITITKPADTATNQPEKTVKLNQDGLDNGGNTISNVKSNLPDTKNNDATTGPSNATKSQKAPNTTNTAGNDYVNPNNAATVGDVLNAGWNLQGNGTDVDFVKPYDKVNFVNGLHTTAVVSTVDGITSNVTYNVTGLPITYTDKDGNPVSKIGDKYYKVNDKGQPLDSKGNPSTKVNNEGKPVDDAGNVIDPIDTATNPVKTSLVNPAPEANKTGTTSPTTLDNVTSKLENYKADPVDGKAPVKNGLRDLSNQNVTDNTVATVGDIRNMGWIVSSDKKTDDLTKDYSETVKNANEVKFVGEGSAIVSGKTDDKGVRTITVKVDDQTSTNNAVTPVVYTDEKGNQVYPTGKKDEAGNPIFNTKPDGSGQPVTGSVKTTINGPKGTTSPTSLSNVKNNIPAVNDADKKVTNPDGTDKPDAGTNINKAPLTAEEAADLLKPTTKDGKPNPNFVGNNAATVSDVLNAGWNLQGNGSAVDFVKPFDTVNFRDGGNTTVTVTTDDNLTSHVQVNVTGLPVVNTVTVNGKEVPVVKVGDTFYPANPDGTPNIVKDKDGNPTNGYVRANDGKLYPRDAVTTKANPDGTTTVEPKADAKPTTVNTNLANPNVENTKDNPGNNVNTPSQLGNVANGANTFNALGEDDKEYVKANNGKYYEPSKVNEDGSLKEGTDADADAKDPLVLANDGKWYKSSEVAPNGTPADTATPVEVPKNVDAAGLVDFSNSNPNNAATVGDLQNLGWIVSAEGNNYSDQVRNANEVKFVGAGTATVTGETDKNGVRTITVTVDDQVSTNNAITPVNYTTADGTKVYPLEDEDGNITYHTTPDGTGDGDEVIAPENVITSLNGPKGTKAPTTLSNVAGNLDGAKKDTQAPTTSHGPVNTTDAAGPNYVNPNNAATVGDVLNAGWNLQNNGEARDFVKPYDTVNFINGKGTVAVVETADDAASSTVKFDVDTGEITADTTKPGAVKGPVTADEAKKLADDLEKAEQAVKDLPADAPKDKKAEAQKVLKDAQAAAAPLNKVATAQNVADMINASGFTLKTSATADGKKESGDDEVINPGKAVEMIAGKNLTVKQEANGKVTYATKDDVSFNTVNVGEPETYKNAAGETVVKGNDGKFYKPNELNADGKPNKGATGLERDKVTVENPQVTLKREAAKEARNNANKPSSALNVSSSDGKPTQLKGVGSVLDATAVPTTPEGSLNGKAPTEAAKQPKLVNLTNADGSPLDDAILNSAATVRDIANMGWVVSTKDSNGYKDVVKNANQVDFVGKNGITVTGETKDGIRTITVETAQSPVVYTDKAGNKLVKAGGNFYPADSVVFGDKAYPAGSVVIGGKVYPKGTTPEQVTAGTATPATALENGKKPADVIASMNNGDDKSANAPMQLGNVAQGAETIAPVDADGNKLVKANDGKYYPEGKVKADGSLEDGTTDADVKQPLKLANDGKWYPADQISAKGVPTDTAKAVTPPAKMDPAAGLVDFANSNPNNAATIGDLQNMGWIVGAPTNGYTDQVRNTNKVNFVGTGIATVTGETDAKGVRTITVNVANGLVDVAKNEADTATGAVTGPKKAAEDALKAAKAKLDELNNKPTATEEEKKAAQDAVNKAQSAVNNAPNLVATAQNVADMINKSGFNLKTSAAEGQKVKGTKDEGELINPGATVEMVAGKNMSVKQDDNGKVTYATKDDVEFNTVKIANPNGATYTDKNNNPLVKADDGKYYPADQVENGKVKDPATATPVEADKVTTKAAPSVEFKAENATPATNNTGKDKDGKAVEPTTALNISSDDGKPTQLKGVGSVLNTTAVPTAPEGTKDGKTVTPEAEQPKLVNLEGKKDPKTGKVTEPLSDETLNSAATVRDIANMGWIVSAKDGNGYTDVVKNANKVDFKGGTGITITGKTLEDGTRQLTVGIKEGEVTDKVTVTHKDGTKTGAVKIGDNYYKLGKDGKPEGFQTDVNGKPAGTPLNIDKDNDVITNSGSGFVTGNTVATAIQESGWNVGLADSSKANEAFNGDSKALSADKLEKVNPDDNVRFADGKNTKVQAATMDEVNKDGKKITNTYVRFNVDLPISQITSEDKDGNKVAKAADGKWYPVKEGKPDTTKEALEPSNVRTSASMDPDGLGDKYTSTTSREEGLTPTQIGELTGKQAAAAKAAEEKIKDLLKGQSKDVIEAASKAAVDAAKEEAKVQYLKDKGLDKGTGGTVISNVAWGTKPSDAVNVDQLQNSGINVHSRTVEGSTGKVISGNTSPTKVKMDETVNVDAGNNIEITRNGRDIAIATSMTPQFDSVQFGKEGPKITNKAGNINVSGPDGKTSTKITGVAPGEISATSKDAINGSQLHAVASNLNNKINKVGKHADAGTASALAAANIPQAYTPGKSLVGIAAGNYQGQNGLAVGMSRISDNGKIIIRLSGTANSQGKTGVAAGVGYQW